MLSSSERITAARPNPDLAGPPFDARVHTLQDPAAEIEAKEIAFEGILSQYGPEMLGVARYHTRSREDAEDAYQDGCLEAWRKLGETFEGSEPESLPGWLAKVVHHKARKIIKKNSGREARTAILKDPDATIDYMQANDPGVPDTVIAKEGLKEMLATLRPSLSDRDLRRLLQSALRVSNEEVVVAEGVSGPGNVRIQTHRAKKKAKAALV